MSLPKKKVPPTKSGYKAIIFDCDGTLIESKIDALPSLRVTEIINNISGLIHVGIATQRSFFNARPILEHLKLRGPSIINGGARVIDSKTFKTLHEVLINLDDLNKAIKIFKGFQNKYKITLLIQDGEDKDKVWTQGYMPEKPMIGFIPNLKEEVADVLKEKLSVISNISVHKVIPWDGKFGIVISSALATKQHGIFEVAKILGISTHEIIGVGDSYNDFPLLMACGLKVAMGNAVPELKAIADYIAPTVEKDGVVDVINRFVL